MSQQKKLEKIEKLLIGDRMRNFRDRANLSQQELGERLGVSGNYISMLELSKKIPGPSLHKLFEALELSPMYRNEPFTGIVAPHGHGSGNSISAMLSTETLAKSFVEVAEKLSRAGVSEQKVAIGNLREMLDEMERRLLASSGGLSEAQQIAVKAAGKSGGTRGTK